MDLTELANLVLKLANELKEDDRVVRVGEESGVTEVELVLQGSTGDYASGILFTGKGLHSSSDLEEATARIVDVLQVIYDWKALSNRYNLLDAFVNVRRWSGLVRRRLCEQRERKESPNIPGDPLIVF